MCSLSDTLRDLLTGRLPSLLSLAVNSPAAQTTARCQLAAACLSAVFYDAQLPPLQLFIKKKKHPYAASLLSQTAATSFRVAGGVKPGCAKKEETFCV